MVGKYKEVEKMLRDYNVLEYSILDLKSDLKFMEGNTGVKGVNYDSPVVSGGGVGSPTEGLVVGREEEKTKLVEKLRKKEIQYNKINNALRCLCDIEYEILVLRYFRKLGWREVASIVKHSERHCRRKSVDAINNMVDVIDL